MSGSGHSMGQHRHLVIRDGAEEHRVEVGTAAAALVAFVVANAARLDSPMLRRLQPHFGYRAFVPSFRDSGPRVRVQMDHRETQTP